MPSMEEILANFHHLPAVPAVVQELISSLGDTDIEMATLACKISQEPGLAAKVLRVANSSYYGLPRQVGSVQEAVVVLGFNTVRSLVMAAGFINAFPRATTQGFDRQALWVHGFRVGAHARALARLLRLDPEMAFTAGLFHGLGQLVLDVCLHDEFAAVLAARSPGQELREVEQAMLGFDHGMVGGEVAKRWNFPRAIEHAIRYKDFADAAQFEPVTALVRLACLLDKGAGRGDARDWDIVNEDVAQMLTLLGLDWQRVRQCLPVQEQLDAGAAVLLAA